MSFFRHREIFRSDVIRLVRERHKRRSRPHRLDEFPAGYSLADCSPAGSASASPTEDHSALKSSCRSIRFHRTVNSVLTVCLSLGDHPTFALQRWRAHTRMICGGSLPKPASEETAACRSWRLVSVSVSGGLKNCGGRSAKPVKSNGPRVVNVVHKAKSPTNCGNRFAAGFGRGRI